MYSHAFPPLSSVTEAPYLSLSPLFQFQKIYSAVSLGDAPLKRPVSYPPKISSVTFISSSHPVSQVAEGGAPLQRPAQRLLATALPRNDEGLMTAATQVSKGTKILQVIIR